MGFFQGFSHTIKSWYEHRSHITDKANAGSVLTHLGIFLSALGKASAARSLSLGGMKDVSFPFCKNIIRRVNEKTPDVTISGKLPVREL
jgi:hypothetical protein